MLPEEAPVRDAKINAKLLRTINFLFMVIFLKLNNINKNRLK
jgi:hypothetical protein